MIWTGTVHKTTSRVHSVHYLPNFPPSAYTIFVEFAHNASSDQTSNGPTATNDSRPSLTDLSLARLRKAEEDRDRCTGQSTFARYAREGEKSRADTTKGSVPR